MGLGGVRKRKHVKITLTLPDGSTLDFREDDIIRCVVSLRSDLSVVDPTLPESELDAEIYAENLVQGVIANLPDETAITYTTALYTTGAISWEWPTRYFYTDEVSWENNILKIHARDQVHKLDEELPPLYIGQRWMGEANRATTGGLYDLYLVFCDCINGTATKSGEEYNGLIEHLSISLYQNYEGTSSSGNQVNAILERATRRETIAKLMNLCRFDFPTGYLNEPGLFSNKTFYLTYVDAGNPTISARKDESYTIIYEEDCGDIKEYRDQNVSKYNFRVRDVIASSSNGQVVEVNNVQALAQKQKGISMEYSGLLDMFQPCVRLSRYNQNYGGLFDLWSQYGDEAYYTRARPYKPSFTWDYDALRNERYGYWLFDENIASNPFNFTQYEYIDLSGSKWTTPGASATSPAETWQDYIDAGFINSTAQEASLEVWGYFYNL